MPAFVVAALLSPFFAACLSASEVARTFHIRVVGESLRVSVPKTFEPLLPGSVYPNRRKPVDARRLPVAIVDREALPAREFLLERKFLVVERGSAPVSGVLAVLAAHPEADSDLAAVIGFRNLPPVPSGVRAVVILDPDLAAGNPSPPTGAVALFLRTPARTPSVEFTRVVQARFGPGLVEKWYRDEVGFPEQAYRDVAEWSASAVAR